MAEQLSDKTIKELLALGVAQGAPKEVGGVPYAIVPNDCSVKDLSAFRFNDFSAAPHRKKGTVAVLDAASFIEYYTLFSDANSRVFADETKSQVLAVLDYHGAGDGGPRWGQHRVRLDLRKSPEWLTWMNQNGQAKKMSQMEFAEFIEDNTPDIREPNAATMLEMARSLQAKTDVDFSSAIRTNNGQVQFKYTENVKGTYGNGNVEIPESFTVGIPVYVGTQRVAITARLRYRLNSGKLSIWYDLLRADAIERDAFMSTLAEIKQGLSVTIINGVPA
jgi:uncharacterized protein YfdQ (DUF2303 family)